MTQQAKKPVHQIRLGNIKAAVWESEAGEFVRHNVTFTRSFRKDGEWFESQTYGRDDLPRLKKCADLAYEWIFANGGRVAEDDETVGAES